MKKIKPMIILAILMNSFAATNALAKDHKISELELFPAVYESGNTGNQGLSFLTDKPFNLSITSYELDVENLRADLKMSEASSKNFSEFTKKYLEKWIAIVVNGKIVSSPKILTEIKGKNLAISFGTLNDFESFKKVLEATVKK